MELNSKPKLNLHIHFLGSWFCGCSDETFSRPTLYPVCTRAWEIRLYRPAALLPWQRWRLNKNSNSWLGEPNNEMKDAKRLWRVEGEREIRGDAFGWFTTTGSLLNVGANYRCFIIKTNFSNCNFDYGDKQHQTTFSGSERLWVISLFPVTLVQPHDQWN